MKNRDYHNNKFVTAAKVVSKETSVANSSGRVYYGALAAGAIPFMWESQPGTPKHTLSETSLPPLTPPPSYSSKATPKHSVMQKSGSRAKALLESLFHKALNSRKAARSMSWSPSSSLSWSSTSSSSTWSPASSSKSGQKRLVDSRIPFGRDEDEDEDSRRSSSPTSILCFGMKRRNASSNYFRGYDSVRRIKVACLSVASQDQSADHRRRRSAMNY